jgi:hypothetical protein
MLFMDKKGDFTIINELRWGARWEKGVWYSKGEHLNFYLTGQDTPWIGSNTTKVGGYDGWASELWGPYDEADPLYDIDTGNSAHTAANRAARTQITTPAIQDISTTTATNEPANRTTADIIPFKPVKGMSKKARKAARKMMAKAANKRLPNGRSTDPRPAVAGPDMDYSTNLVFDYGYLGRTGYYDSRFKEVGECMLPDHQLWALGNKGAEMPAILPSTDLSTTGKLYKITKDYKSVMDDLDQAYGCDFFHPDISVFHRRWLECKLIKNGVTIPVWAWTFRFAMSLNDMDTAAVVPFGDWSRWDATENVYPVSPIQRKKELLSS